MSSKDTTEIQKFNGKKKDDYILWRRGYQTSAYRNGGEYTNIQLIKYSDTTPGTPQLKPYSERIKSRTLVEQTRILLERAGLSSRYREYTMEHKVYIKNRDPQFTIKRLHYKKLIEKSRP